MVHDNAVLTDTDFAIGDLADTDAAYKFIVVDGGDQHLGAGVRIALRGGNGIDDGVEEGLHRHARGAEVERGNSGFGRGKDKRAVELLVARAEIHQKLEHFIDDLRRTRTGAVNLIDTDNDRQIEVHCLGEDKACLGHRSLKRIDDQDGAVDHLQNALDFAAKIRMTGRVDDIDFDAVVVDGSILGKYGDAALPLDGIGVHDAVLYFLICAEHTALTKQSVHQGRLAMVDMGDNGNVTDILSCFDHILLLAMSAAHNSILYRSVADVLFLTSFIDVKTFSFVQT